MRDSAVKENPSNLNNQEYDDSAIPSWSGFVYQGKVALLHSIHLIFQKGKLANDFELQLDSIEDFSILGSDDDNPLSIHQVKAVNSNRFSSYNEAFKKQIKKSKKYPSAKVFFHTAKEISDEVSDGFEVIKLYDYERISKDPEKKKYCPLNSIDDEIDRRIKRFFEVHFKEQQHRLGSSYIERCRSSLEQVILKQVIKIHSKIHDEGIGKDETAFKETIKFETLCSILDDDLNKQVETEEYFLWRLKGSLATYYQQFCYETDMKDHMQSEKLSRYMVKINAFGINEIKNYILNILPHRQGNFNNLDEFINNAFTEEEMCDSFFQILHDLQTYDGEYETQIYWKRKNTVYVPTAIDKASSLAEKVCYRLIKNGCNGNLDLLYRGGKMITAGMDVRSVAESSGNILDINNDNNQTKNITRWNNISLVSLSEAKKVINA